MTYYDLRDGRRRRRRVPKNDYAPGMLGNITKRRRFSLFDWLMIIISLVVAVGFVFSWAARWISPISYGFMSAAGLFAPVFFAANFLCLLYWVIRWRRGAWISLTIIVWGLGSMTLFYRPELTESYSDFSRDRSLVSLTTYNVHGLQSFSSDGKFRSSISEVAAVVDSLRPDILCLQEFASSPQHPASEFESRLRMNYRLIRYNISSEGGSGSGNAIFSKFPLAASGFVDFEGTGNAILWADIAIRRDTVRLFNAHLQTTAIKADDETYITELNFTEDPSRVRGIVGRLTRNYIIRAAQADSLASMIASSPYPVVVCGDFNDTPASYAYRAIARHLRDSFRQAGRGYGYTYRGFFNLLRIDYILHSPSLECVDYLSPSFSASDHNPVSVRLRVRPSVR